MLKDDPAGTEIDGGDGMVPAVFPKESAEGLKDLLRFDSQSNGEKKHHSPLKCLGVCLTFASRKARSYLLAARQH